MTQIEQLTQQVKLATDYQTNKKILKEKLTTQEYNTYIGPIHTDQDQQNFELMLSETKKQDIAKKISMKDYLPELVSLF